MAAGLMKAEIKDMNDKFLAVANVSTFTGTTMFLRHGELPVLEEGMYVYVYVFNEYDGVTKYSGRIDFSISNQLRIVDVDKIETFQRRKNIKVKANIESYIDYFVMLNGEKIRLSESIPIFVKDISIGGIYFECDRALGTKQRFIFAFREEIIPAEIVTEVLRTQKASGYYKYGYGCRFIEPTRRDEDLINKFIVKVQMEELRRARR